MEPIVDPGPLAARHQQQVEELCAGTIRALSGETDLHFRGRRLHRGSQALPHFSPHLHPRPQEDDFSSFRGAADGLALRLLRSDPALHGSLCPGNPLERLLFELLEQIRVESQWPAGMRGVAHNLRHRYAQWSLRLHHCRLTDSDSGLLLYTVAQICRARVTGEPVLEETQDLLEATRAAIGPIIGRELAGLVRHRSDQAAYAQHARNIAKRIAEMIESANATGADASTQASEAQRAAFSLLLDFDAEVEDGVAALGSGCNQVFDGDQGRYKIFTTAYDREVRAAALVRNEVLVRQRERLDQCIAASGLNIARLARQLRALLCDAGDDGWDSAQEEGRIDGRRLAQLVASPTERRLFRTERQHPVADAVFTFLIDCSGSMKQHIESVAVLVDVFVRALEQAGVASEVLGFTTGAWNGGHAQRDWLRAGRPLHPGRLNEVCHLVFKDADTSWRSARLGVAALLSSHLFREGVDGEAVEWACRRLDSRAEQRRLLLVVSDGCPMDGATKLANDAHYLDNHLRDVVAKQEWTARVAVFGVGVGLDLSPYYSRSQALDLAALPDNAALRDLLTMLGGHRRR
ncbi:MAG: cobalt chelatase [Betaproteobacteria bacterium]